jgi:Uma2 family endonuclease
LLGAAAPPYFTAGMVRALPDDGLRYETVHGELLVTRAPPAAHRQLAARLGHALRRYLGPAAPARVYTAPAGLAPGLDTLVQPDVFVAPSGSGAARAAPMLVAEVVSRSSARADRFTKRRLYQELGVPVYWVPDPAHRVVELWRPASLLPVVEYGRLTWWPAGFTRPFTMPLDELFGDAAEG